MCNRKALRLRSIFMFEDAHVLGQKIIAYPRRALDAWLKPFSM
jgi:hypothetical protein